LRQASQREKEAELAFRGEQYVRAIKLFSQRAGPGVLPPSVDVLVNQKFLRKKFKDPITGGDFDLLGATQPTAPGAGAGRGAPQPGGPQSAPQPGAGGRSAAAPTAAPATATASPPGAGTIIQGRGGPGGIIGVASKSKETSIRLYNGRSHYNEWPFVYIQQTQQPGNTAPGPATQRGGAQGRGINPQRGQPPGGRGPGMAPPTGPTSLPRPMIRPSPSTPPQQR
jgi:hypothetical protein